MSTNDVPGHNPSNCDELRLGCWAEHKDGSLIFVESTEGGRAIYSIFDMAKSPPIEYRDAMPEISFKATFSWDPSGKKPGPNIKWTWHDKTPFPWDRIIKAGHTDGPRLPSAAHVMTAAQRVAESLRLRGAALDRGNVDHRMDKEVARSGGILSRIMRAIRNLPEDRPHDPPAYLPPEVVVPLSRAVKRKRGASPRKSAAPVKAAKAKKRAGARR